MNSNSLERSRNEGEAQVCGAFDQESLLAFAIGFFVGFEALFDVGHAMPHGEVEEDGEFAGGGDGGDGGIGAPLQAAVKAAECQVAAFADTLGRQSEELSGGRFGAMLGAPLPFARLGLARREPQPRGKRLLIGPAGQVGAGLREQLEPASEGEAGQLRGVMSTGESQQLGMQVRHRQHMVATGLGRRPLAFRWGQPGGELLELPADRRIAVAHLLLAKLPAGERLLEGEEMFGLPAALQRALDGRMAPDIAKFGLDALSVEVLETLEVTRRKAVMDQNKQVYDSTLALSQNTKSVSKEDLSKSEAEYNVSTAEYKIAVQQLANRQLTAPFSGSITEILLRPGAPVAPYQPLVRLVDTSRCYFTGHVEGLAAANLQQDEAVMIEVDFVERRFAAIQVVQVGDQLYEIGVHTDFRHLPFERAVLVRRPCLVSLLAKIFQVTAALAAREDQVFPNRDAGAEGPHVGCFGVLHLEQHYSLRG